MWQGSLANAAKAARLHPHRFRPWGDKSAVGALLCGRRHGWPHEEAVQKMSWGYGPMARVAAIHDHGGPTMGAVSSRGCSKPLRQRRLRPRTLPCMQRCIHARSCIHAWGPNVHARTAAAATHIYAYGWLYHICTRGGRGRCACALRAVLASTRVYGGAARTCGARRVNLLRASTRGERKQCATAMDTCV